MVHSSMSTFARAARRGGEGLPVSEKSRQPGSLPELLFKSASRAMGSQLGRFIVRGVPGSIFGRR
jgi:uncharacterized protein